MDVVENALASLLGRLEDDCSLSEPRHLRRRIDALDTLDLFLLEEKSVAPPLVHRARALCTRLESVNSRLYENIRRDIQRGEGKGRLLAWRPDWNVAPGPGNHRGYDYLDELLAGVLQFEAPSAELVPLESEMVAYQPTPARHIFDFISRTALTEQDFLVDLGSGLGQVALITSICTSASCTGVELEPSYVACARKSARELNLGNVQFIQGDVRAADLSHGTVFYLYTPFSGAILGKVLNSLRKEAEKRKIRVCTFGPCTPIVAEQVWLSPFEPVATDKIAIFRS